MRVIVLSDIHGNLTALEAVAAALPPADRVIAAGDFCLEGPQPARVWDLLQDLGWDLLMGNTDRDIATAPAGLKRKKAAIMEWTRAQLGPARIVDLASLPFSRRAGPDDALLVVHANPVTMDRHLYPTMTEEELRPFLNGVQAEVIAFGHLHIPYIRPVLDHVLVDVSSVGHPKDHDRRAAFTLFEWNGGARAITQYRVPYDVERTVHQLRTCGMPYGEEEADDLLKASY